MEMEGVSVGDENSFVKFVETALYRMHRLWREHGVESMPIIDTAEKIEDLIYRKALRENAPVTQDCIWLKKEAILWYQDRWRKVLTNLSPKHNELMNWKKVFEENLGNVQNLLTILLREDGAADQKKRRKSVAPAGGDGAAPKSAAKKSRKGPAAKAAAAPVVPLTPYIPTLTVAAQGPSADASLGKGIGFGAAAAAVYDLPPPSTLTAPPAAEAIKIDESVWRAKLAAAVPGSGPSASSSAASMSSASESVLLDAKRQLEADRARQLDQHVYGGASTGARSSVVAAPAVAVAPIRPESERERMEREREKARLELDSLEQTINLNMDGLDDVNLWS